MCSLGPGAKPTLPSGGEAEGLWPSASGHAPYNHLVRLCGGALSPSCSVISGWIPGLQNPLGVFSFFWFECIACNSLFFSVGAPAAQQPRQSAAPDLRNKSVKTEFTQHALPVG